jgi:hypothetical protein
MELELGEKYNNSVGGGRGDIKKENCKIRKNKRLYHVLCAIKKISTK